MKDSSFAKIKAYKKYKDLYDFNSIECIVSMIFTILFEIILLIWRFYEGTNDIINSLGTVINGIGIGLIGFLGFIVTGLAILTGAISSKVVKRLQSRSKMESLERILLSFYLLGITSAMLILLSILIFILSLLPIDGYFVVVFVVGAFYSYFTVFTVFYAVKLIGNCLELFLIVNEMQIIDDEKGMRDKARYNDYRLMALEKIGLSTTSEEMIELYRNCIHELIKTDITTEEEKNIYFEMLKKQFGE